MVILSGVDEQVTCVTWVEGTMGFALFMRNFVPKKLQRRTDPVRVVTLLSTWSCDVLESKSVELRVIAVVIGRPLATTAFGEKP